MKTKYLPSWNAIAAAALYVAAFVMQDQSGITAKIVTQLADIFLWVQAFLLVSAALFPLNDLKINPNVSPTRVVVNSAVVLLPVSIYAPPFLTVILIFCVMIFHAKLTTWLKDLNELQSNDSNL